MSIVRLYVDEDASESAVILGLRARGVDLVTTCETGRLATSDESQLAFATEVGRVIYTFNASDFRVCIGSFWRADVSMPVLSSFRNNAIRSVRRSGD